MKRIIALSVLIVFASCLSANAAIVAYSQPYNYDIAYYSDLERSMFVADDFTLTNSHTITDVYWWGEYYITEASPDDFTVAFYNEAASPAATPFKSYAVGPANRTDTGDTFGGDPIYRYSYTLSEPLPLSAGIKYYISIYNNTADTDNDDWAWLSADNGNATYYWRNSTTGGWEFRPTYDFAFRLTVEGGGPVIPEPITSTLFVGSILFGLTRFRRRLN